MSKPLKEQYPAYYQSYIELVPSDELLPALKDNTVDIIKLFRDIPLEKMAFRYSEGRWTVKEILVHLNDMERILSTRVLRISRRDETPLPGFDEDQFVANYKSNISVNDLLEEFQLLRASDILLFKNLPEGALNATGVANGEKMSVNAIGFFMVGHAIHHYNVLKEKYLA